MQQLDPSLIEAWRTAWEPPERLGIREFSEQYVSLPPSYAIPGPVSLGRSRYMHEVFEALQNPRVRIVVVQAAVQCGKSLIADLFLPWVTTNAIGNVLWITADQELGDKYSETRINPILNGCQPVREMLPQNRHFRRKNSILFNNAISINIGGANASNLQSLSVRYLIGDEVWLWKAGYLQQFLARATAFPHTSKALIISQAADETHDFTELWRKGHQAEWGWTCPHCGKEQPYYFNSQRPDGSWAGVLWDKNEITKPKGRYNLVEVGKTARLECFHCKGTVLDTPTNRRILNDSGVYVPANPNADPTIRSFTWNALANMDISVASVVSQYVQAKESDEIAGYRVPLQHFTQKVLAKPWNPNLQTLVSKAALGEYDPAKEWADEAHRFLTADVQADHFWYVIRAWSRMGESRLLSWGRVETWEQLREVQEKFSVKDQKVFVDSSYDTPKVYAQCVKYGHWGMVGGRKLWLCWNALKGSDYQDFTHIDAKGNREKRLYSPQYQGNPGLGQYSTGQRCAMYMWSNPTVKDILKRHRDGKAAKFLVPTDDPEYNAQMNSEIKRKFVDAKTGKEVWRFVRIGQRPNHAWDCEGEQIVAASLVGCLGDVSTTLVPAAEVPAQSTPA